jgi:2-(1,2-epoxy-1,2-dihydrophenyl)acetyl-CoA isomerase
LEIDMNQNPSSLQTVQYQVNDAVAEITLNRPEVLNAMNEPLMLDLRTALDAAAANPSIRAVLLTGAGRGFCAGADLASVSFGKGPADLGKTLIERYHPVIITMRTMAKPVITAINGAAAGAGMSLALAGDIVLAGQSASFLQAFSKIGLIPDAGSTYFLPRLVGEVRARALTILADKISATEAERYGLVWKVYEDAELMAQARVMAQRLSQQPTKAYALIKQALNASFEATLADQLDLEANLQNKAGKTTDFIEGVTAFIQKRQPNFSGQ